MHMLDFHWQTTCIGQTCRLNCCLLCVAIGHGCGSLIPWGSLHLSVCQRSLTSGFSAQTARETSRMARLPSLRLPLPCCRGMDEQHVSLTRIGERTDCRTGRATVESATVASGSAWSAQRWKATGQRHQRRPCNATRPTAGDHHTSNVTMTTIKTHTYGLEHMHLSPEHGNV